MLLEVKLHTYLHASCLQLWLFDLHSPEHFLCILAPAHALLHISSTCILLSRFNSGRDMKPIPESSPLLLTLNPFKFPHFTLCKVNPSK
jgi:hypothetical protein